MIKTAFATSENNFVNTIRQWDGLANDNGGSSVPSLTSDESNANRLAVGRTRTKLSVSSADENPRRKLSESRGFNLPNIILNQVHIENHHNVTTPLTGTLTGTLMKTSPTTHENYSKALLDICIFLPDQRGIQFTVEAGRSAASFKLHRLVCDHLRLALDVAVEAFSLWMVSPLLEVQLKPHHVPFQIRKHWADLLRKFTLSSDADIEFDEPLIMFRRNLALSISRQQEICSSEAIYQDQQMSKLSEYLYLDAKAAILSGNYHCSLTDCLELCALQMVLEWGPCNAIQHTEKYIREKLPEFVPAHLLSSVRTATVFNLPVVGCRGLESDILDNFKRYSQLSPDKLRLRYLSICMKLPTYGSASFSGSLEKVEHGILRLFSGTEYRPVRIAISEGYVIIIDQLHSPQQVLLCLPLLACDWLYISENTELSAPSAAGATPESNTAVQSLFFHFSDSKKQGISHVLQVFSKQAVMMSALLNSFVDALLLEDGAKQMGENVDINRGRRESVGSDINNDASRLARLCVATFDEEGVCSMARGSLNEYFDVLKK